MAPSAAPLAVKSETAVPGMAPRAERIVCAVMAVLFSFSAAVQYNDPDPIRWAAIYLAAMAVCIGYVARPMPALPAVLVAVASLGWALIWAPGAFGSLPSAGDVATDFKMMSPGVEEFREELGLLIVVVTMAILAVRSRARARASRSST